MGLGRLGASALEDWRGVVFFSIVGSIVSVPVRAIAGLDATRGIMRWWSRKVVDDLGIAVESSGNCELTKPRVIVVNHASLLDIPVLGAALRGDFRWVAKRSLFFVPFLGWYLWASGHVPVDRGRSGNFERMRRAAEQAFGCGESIIIFPEGTRSPDGTMGDFRSGAFALAVDMHVPVLPVVVSGTSTLLRKGSLRYPRGAYKRVDVRVLGELDVPQGGDRRSKVEGLRDEARRRMALALAEIRDPEVG